MGDTTRPLGVTLIAIIFILVGVLFIAIGALFASAIGITLWTANVLLIPGIGAMLNSFLTPILTGYGTVIGIVAIVIGILPILAAIGMFMLKPWGHTLGLLGSIVAIVLIIGIVFIWYLTLDDTKSAFGKY